MKKPVPQRKSYANMSGEEMLNKLANSPVPAKKAYQSPNLAEIYKKPEPTKPVVYKKQDNKK